MKLAADGVDEVDDGDVRLLSPVQTCTVKGFSIRNQHQSHVFKFYVDLSVLYFH